MHLQKKLVVINNSEKEESATILSDIGKFADIRYNEWDSGYVEALISENLIDPATVREEGNKLFFRPDDDLTYDELDSFLMRFYEPEPGMRDIPVDECVRRARKLGIDTRTDDSNEVLIV